MLDEFFLTSIPEILNCQNLNGEIKNGIINVNNKKNGLNGFKLGLNGYKVDIPVMIKKKYQYPEPIIEELTTTTITSSSSSSSNSSYDSSSEETSETIQSGHNDHIQSVHQDVMQSGQDYHDDKVIIDLLINY